MSAPTQTGTIELVTPLPVSVGDLVTFHTTADVHGNPNLRVRVLAYQNGELVYGEAGDPDHEFQLGGNPDRGSIWVQNGGGPADCHADLFYFTKKANVPDTVYLAACSFPAE